MCYKKVDVVIITSIPEGLTETGISLGTVSFAGFCRLLMTITVESRPKPGKIFFRSFTTSFILGRAVKHVLKLYFCRKLK